MNIVICGFGRAGQALAKKILNSKSNHLEMIICRNTSANANNDIGDMLYGVSNNIKITPIDVAEKLLLDKTIDVVIDFSHHDMAIQLLNFCGKINSNLVICTTNHSIEEISQFQYWAANKKIGVVYCPNLTIGINLLTEFTKKISKVFSNFDFEIIEKHPKDKKKPTATAKILAQNTGKDDISIHSIRMGGYIGYHQLIATDGIERITITHESLSREAFANGAILAAEFIQNKIGLFLMQDVINNLEKQEISPDKF